MKKGIFLLFLSFAVLQPLVAQELPAINEIEIHAYISQDQIPLNEPMECPFVEESVEEDELALAVIGTINFELIQFWGNDPVEGVEGGIEESQAVFWRIFKPSDDAYEVIVKTKSIIIGQKITNYLEQQSIDNCFSWGLVFNNEEMVVEEDPEEPTETIFDVIQPERIVENFDPYEGTDIVPIDDVLSFQEVAGADIETGSELDDIYSVPNEKVVKVAYETDPVIEEEEERPFSSMMPAASTEMILPTDFFSSAQTLGEVESILLDVLDSRGYVNKGYFEFDHGFMIATQMEHINSNRSFKPGQYRYPSRITFNQSLSFNNYLKSLFLPERGLFRMYVLYVESAPNRSYSDNSGIDYAVSQLSTNSNKRKSGLSERLREQTYSPKNEDLSNVTVLVYECQTDEGQRRPTLIASSTLAAKDHLVRSGLWDLLK